jgi:hypothetical protein
MPSIFIGSAVRFTVRDEFAGACALHKMPRQHIDIGRTIFWIRMMERFGEDVYGRVATDF